MRAASLFLALLLLTGCSVQGAYVEEPAVQPSISSGAEEEPDGTEPALPAVQPSPLPSPSPSPSWAPPKGNEDLELEHREITYFCGVEDCPGHTVDPFVTKKRPRCAEPERSFTVDLSMVGDCLISTYMGANYAGSLNWYAENREPTYFLERVAHVFAGDDFTIANLETVLTDRQLTETEKDHDPAFWFRGPTGNAKILTSSGVEVVSLSNNHIGDYGDEGLADTVQAVKDAGLRYGDGKKTLYLEKNGFVIALICNGLWTQWQANVIVQRIHEAEEQSDYQIVFFHGGVEGTHAPESWTVESCRSLIDAGADLVVGSHPHMLQPMEEYNGKKIVYSLGNFCYGGHMYPENRTVIYKVRLTVDERKVIGEEHEFIPCYVYTGNSNNWQPAPIEDEGKKQHVLDFMAGRRESPF